MARLLVGAPLLLICCSFVSTEVLSTLDADVESLSQESRHDDCSLMQVSQASIKTVRDDRGDHKLHLSRKAPDPTRARALYSELMARAGGYTASISFELAGLGIATYPGCVMVILGLVVVVWLLHSFIQISFRSMPLLSFFFFLFFLLGSFCRTVLPVIWYSAFDVISRSGVFVLLTAALAIFVLMFTPLLLIMPDQETSQLLADCLLDASEKEKAEQQAEVGNKKISLPFRCLALFHLGSAISIFLVAQMAAADHEIAGPAVTTILYGILAWFSLSTLFHVTHPRTPSDAAAPQQDNQSQRSHLGNELAPEASAQGSNESSGFTDDVTAAISAAIDNINERRYVHCILWTAYFAGMLVYSVCLELRICYAIFGYQQVYTAMIWSVTSLCTWFLIASMHMNVIFSHAAFSQLSSGSQWLWQTGKDIVWSMGFALKVVCLGSMTLALICSLLHWPEWAFHDSVARAQVMSALFFMGLALVAAEEAIDVNKSAVMLLLAATEWTILAQSIGHSLVGSFILTADEEKGLLDVAGIIFFLLPAMGVIESIDHFKGFDIVTQLLTWVMKGKKERLMPMMCILIFFLSSVIDNLTATLLAFKILRRLIPNDEDWRHECAGLVVIAANAGGAWSPIGDVTTTMLWIQGKITVWHTVSSLLIPSFVAAMVPLVGISFFRSRPNDDFLRPEPLNEASGKDEITRSKVGVLCLGIFVILLVPVLRMCAGLEPYMGMLLALGVMWLVTDMFFEDEEAAQEGSHRRGVIAALFKVDITALLFFTGVLLSVGALSSAGVLANYGLYLKKLFGSNIISLCTVLGVSSSLVDNVPLVEAAISMFDQYGTDAHLWQLVALAGGTGGSILIIGSIPGVTLMSTENVGFVWYCKRISFWAFLGYTFGIGACRLQYAITAALPHGSL
mmetsp:Transcript_154119/g.287302  ORF Transcript_154119/g.287302 Transcript_154119/m.287302 type:complete len:908 (-) Transcript_154119:169-2892(-)